LAIATAVILLIPGLQCYLSSRKIEGLESTLNEVRQENKRMVAEVVARNSQKQGQVLEARRELDRLDDLLDKTKILSVQTDEARQKLEAVKALIEEHRQIIHEVDDWKRLFPELFSGN